VSPFVFISLNLKFQTPEYFPIFVYPMMFIFNPLSRVLETGYFYIYPNIRNIKTIFPQTRSLVQLMYSENDKCRRCLIYIYLFSAFMCPSLYLYLDHSAAAVLALLFFGESLTMEFFLFVVNDTSHKFSLI
jgi:hypothetical protein